ncbi:bifunctional DNA primase/polymerase [Mycobacteroides abscessus]|uniref:bifunctional DNA primase/polymerase n=1 Tax=Mycobacteroides abscessus TaxID=36809 RepID=UPI001403302A|nr:bifunctional DNA primase/polymerase [Mycobacteroides abscessus]
MPGSPLRIPDLTDDTDVLTAALAYARDGWFVVPVRRDTRHAGSVVGKGWPEQSSRDAKQIVGWFAGTDYGIALHVNRSGAIVLDIDKPDNFRYWDLVNDAMVQQTRPDTDPRRGHYAYLNPGGTYSNSSRGLGTGWGDVRASSNGIIVVAPGIGERRWINPGPVPPCPEAILSRLREGGGPTVEAVPEGELKAFVATHSQRPTVRPDLVARWRTRFITRAVIGKDSRHTTMLGILPEVFRASRIGRVNAKMELNALYAMWAKSVVGTDRNGQTVTESSAMAEFLQMCAWALAQA